MVLPGLVCLKFPDYQNVILGFATIPALLMSAVMSPIPESLSIETKRAFLTGELMFSPLFFLQHFGWYGPMSCGILAGICFAFSTVFWELSKPTLPPESGDELK